jgi:regulator of protease activity HflC (stomatin/prohibitin superfamily)
MVGIPIGIVIGFVGWFMLRYIVTSFYTVNQNERAVKTSFGRAQRLDKATVLALPMGEALRPDERERYDWPQLHVIRPGGPYFVAGSASTKSPLPRKR